MTRVSESQLLLLLLLLMMTMTSASLSDWSDEQEAEMPTNNLKRSARRWRPLCAPTGAECENGHRCCNSNDVCMYIPRAPPDRYQCFRWERSRVIYPQLYRGAWCNDSFQCIDRCCSEHRVWRHAPIYQCDTQFNSYDILQKCITH